MLIDSRHSQVFRNFKVGLPEKQEAVVFLHSPEVSLRYLTPGPSLQASERARLFEENHRYTNGTALGTVTNPTAASVVVAA